PYNHIPVYVPEGSILPVGLEMEWSDEKPAELINLYVFAGKDATFTLYEDEGTNYNYEKGKYATITFSWNDAAKTLTISPRKGSFNGMLKNRRFNVVLVDKDHARGVNIDNNVDGKVVKYSGKAVKVNL
ncbi:MAG: DUF5110 domain-containing protein, partial [Prevotella sp.]